ncbi:hypothetical protein O6H91_03G027600 [Diphasiastrum complanatum]|uniref:Uncharacterized protein n=3 Tax=Diphasiastrum complanatum TaxID=34168 RepID=A0ACC2E4I0_DIPCM|nr:hypothetical protein O6H91_03G027600 [Diphasiastrum complanatum]KAJ7561412.1 hypothetical protein O6H91_03G027600 [Diphasiastrum complanatum]KAJ7561413.1 hypothetical protein O6H91_03G027600 [Diphasiastrum complanatum]
MDTTARSESGDMTSVDRKGLAALQQSFNQVQFLLEHNRLLIKEINRNHRSRIPENLSRNTALINELNGNINRVLCLYANLSTAFLKTFEFSSDVNTAGTSKTDKVMLKSATVQGLKRDVLALENQLLGLQVGTSSASNVGSF